MQFVKKYYGNLLLTTLATVPVLLWLFDYGFSLAFNSGLGTAISSSGKAVALSGFTLFCINPILSMRHPWLEVLFGGLDNVYRLHIKTGKVAFVLISLHPILLGIGRFVAGRDFGVIWDWTSLVVLLGISAFVFLSGLTFTAIYAHVRHQQWIVVHRLFGALIPIFFPTRFLSTITNG